MRVVFSFVFGLLLSSCATTNKYTPLKTLNSKLADCHLDVYMVTDQISKKYETIGVFSVSDSGLSADCDLENSIKANKAAACKAGADAIKFTEVILPTGKSTCVQTQSNFLIYK
jgi:hypothetical protein